MTTPTGPNPGEDARRSRFAPVATDETHRVTTLELFFDLVFVFALTQITAQLANDLTLVGLVRGLVIAALMWWAWVGYSWLGNIARADEGVTRATILVSMGALLIVALTIPEAFDDLPGGLNAPVVLALALAVPRLAQVVGLYLASTGDAELQRTIRRFASVVVLAQVLLLVGALIGPPWLTIIWAVALAVDYGGTLLLSPSGWRLPSPGHFAERHGLILIIFLGESIVAIGVGAAQLPISVPIIAVSLLSLGITVSLWWLYFDVTSIAAERALARSEGKARTALARDAYSYIHFFMAFGIVLLAVGLKKATQYVGDEVEHDLSDPMPVFATYSLLAGVALFVLALVLFRIRVVHSASKSRLIAAAVLIVAGLVVTGLPALAVVAICAAVMAGLVAFEAVHYAELRHRVRHRPGH